MSGWDDDSVIEAFDAHGIYELLQQVAQVPRRDCFSDT
jgi:hypothetical protein